MTDRTRPAAAALALGSLLVAAASLPAAPAGAAGGVPSAWDRDGDGRVSRAEYRAEMARRGAYARWDRDGDGRLSREELRAPRRAGQRGGAFAAWNADDNDWIDEREVMNGYFDSYDTNGDLWLDSEEIGEFENESRIEGVYD